jgi:DNA uptake protein ComE-like DNA-binding protein
MNLSVIASPHWPAQQGFILAATLWILAFMTIAVGFLAQWTSTALEQARTEQSHVDAEIELQSTLAGVVYLLTTQELSQAGLTLPDPRTDVVAVETLPITNTRVIRLDDQPVKGIGETLFSLQDEGGLVPANLDNPWHLSNLLGLLGVPGTERGALIAKLLDYRDRDELHRLNGAEADHYRKQGRPPPPNRNLRTGWEMANILGWDEYAQLWTEHSLPRSVNSVWNGYPNFNTAPEQVLQTWTGIDQADAQRIVEERQKIPLRSLSQIHQIIGKRLSISPLDAILFPSRYLRITLWQQGGRRMREIHLQLTPMADNRRPWLVEYAIELPLTPVQERAEPLALDIPLFAAQYSAEKR